MNTVRNMKEEFVKIIPKYIAEPRIKPLVDQLRELDEKSAKIGRIQWLIVEIVLMGIICSLVGLGLHYIVVLN